MDPVDVGTTPPAGAVREPAPAARVLSADGITARLRWLIRGGGETATDPVADLIREHRAVHPRADGEALRRAYDLAARAHQGQWRKSGEPYITHPLAVARILAALGMDTTTLVAALLHDTVEDTSYTLQALYQDFGPDVATVVDGVTKVERVSYGDDAEAETIRKMVVAAGRDVRVLVVKLADRLHNMRTLDARSPASQVRIARATRDVLVPLAERLGIQALRRELEDYVLRYLEPDAYGRITEYLHDRPQWDDYLAELTAAARAALKRHRVDADIEPRPRHHYSIWKDTVAGGHGRPFDLPRIVVVVHGAETDCYAALGAMHATWRPVPGRFKDFIASPKHNLYRSLHTTLIGPQERAAEVLIRTEAMHRDAEYGIAASYRFRRVDDTAGVDQLPWLRRLLDWERDAPDPAQFLDALHSDLVESQIHVFTPTGAQVLLPAEATPVDLAYVLDTRLGDQCVAALINGRLAPLSCPLADGDVVDVLTRGDTAGLDTEAGTDAEAGLDTEAGTDAEAGAVPDGGPGKSAADTPAGGPSREWLSFVKTPHARLQISRWFAEHDDPPRASTAHKVRLGRAAIGLALRRRDRGLASDEPLLRLAVRLGYPDLDALLVAVAEHRANAERVVDDLIALVDHGPGSAVDAGSPPTP